jgi:hypothetical protein
MAHAAELDSNNKVIRVIVISNDYEPNIEQFATELFGGIWKQTSYNCKFRYNFAAIGDTYDANADAFIQPQNYPSWVLDENYRWTAPTPKPKEGKWRWDEATLSWIEANG